MLLAYGCHFVIWWLALKAGLKHLITPTDTLSASWKATVVLDEARMKYGWGVSWCVYKSWKFPGIWNCSWKYWKSPGIYLMLLENFITGSVIFARQAVFCTLYRQVLGFVFHKLAQWWALLGTHHHMLSYRYYKLHTCILTLYSLSSCPDCSPFIKL